MATARPAAAAANMTNTHGAAPSMSTLRMDMLSASPLRFGVNMRMIASRKTPAQVGIHVRAHQPSVRLPARSAAAERRSLLRGRSPSCSAFCLRLGLAFSVRSLLIQDPLPAPDYDADIANVGSNCWASLSNPSNLASKSVGHSASEPTSTKYPSTVFAGIVNARTGSWGETRDIRAI